MVPRRSVIPWLAVMTLASMFAVCFAATQTSTHPAAPAANTTTTGITTTAAASSDGLENVRVMKLIQILLIVITGLLTGMLGIFKLAKRALALNLQTDDFREALMKIVYREFDSSEGVKNIGRAVLRHYHDAGRDDLRKVVLEVLSSPEAEPGMAKLIVRLADVREEGKELVEKSQRDLRRSVQPQMMMGQTADELEQTESELHDSKINRLGEDPLINGPALRDLMMGVLRLLQPPPSAAADGGDAEKKRSPT